MFPFGRIKEYLQTVRIKIADSSHTLLIRTLILVALLVSPGLAQAGDIYLLINGHSEHFGDAPDGSKLNEKNYGVGLQYEISENKRLGLKPFVTLSIFKDSNFNWSGYAGGGYLKRFKISNNGFDADMGVAGFLMVRKYG
ncbi:MAG: hypothetical protein D6732_05875 [Methanobacteriota archaeon]|nr:MAG: hypothetical protein D6732_05875 [Euryarchaeota archaeon]